jgi:hypothetical protein
MRLNLTALCLLLLNLQCRVLADDAKNDLVEEPKHTAISKTLGQNVQHETSNNVDSNSSENDDEGENDNGAGDEDTKIDESSSETAGNTDIVSESNAENPTDTIEPEIIVTKAEKKIVPKQNIVTAVEASESLEESNRESSTNSINDSTHAFIETSKDVTAQLYNAISGIATTNITMDAWKNQTWANKTPREVVDMIENEINIMFHDKYVHIVIISMGLMSILFTLYVVQQIIEHPTGVLSKFCRCTIACLRILCCPLYTILCCPCCTTKKNRPNTKEYSHLPLHDVIDASKKN